MPAGAEVAAAPAGPVRARSRAGVAPAAVVDATPLKSADLLRGAQEVLIEHNARTYRLRVTAQGKLILTA